MYYYTAYSLRICSAFPLPELVTGGSGDDVIIEWGNLGRVPYESRPVEILQATTEEVRLALGRVAIASIRNGRRIIVDKALGVEDRVLRLFILGPVLSTLLCQRNYLVLHASAVEVNGTAIAFLGHKGAGKSTTAAALHTRGHSLIVDDVLAIEVENTAQPRVLPGFPQLKLWPDALSSLGEDPATLIQLHPNLAKRSRPATYGLTQTPLPLKRIYLLSYGSVLKSEPLQRQATLPELIRHTYAFPLIGTEAIDPAGHLRQCSRVVSQIPMYSLERPRDTAALSQLAVLIEQQMLEFESLQNCAAY